MAKRKKAAAKQAAAPCERVNVSVECQVHESFRVAQVAGMFDVTLAEKARETFSVELPGHDELIADSSGVPQPWQIGVIVGPSGSGKSTIARAAYGERLYTGSEWPVDRAVIDCFPEEVSTRDVTALLSSVGFSTPPAWIKPYHVLSNGERFRCDLARALISGQTPIVFDEFTSVVDRTVARTGSVAVSKHVRRQAGLKFVAVTCHYDIVEWLEPDWVLDMASCQLARGRLRRPTINVELHRASARAWKLFARAHYLSGTIPSGCRLYVGLVDGQPAACVVTANLFGRHRVAAGKLGNRRITRLVVLPDFQGVGIGGRMLDAVAELLDAERMAVSITTGHPSMIAILKRAARWRIVSVKTSGAPRTRMYKSAGNRIAGAAIPTSAGRAVVSARYISPPAG